MARNIVDYTRGKLIKPCLEMAVPLFLSRLLQSLYNSADVAVAGKFLGDDAIAAIGATSQITNLLLNFIVGIALATNIICAVAFGAGDIEKFKRTTHTSIGFSFIVGAFFGLIGIVFARPLLVMISTPEDIMDQAVLYMRIYFAAAPFTSAYNFCFNIFKSVGDSKRPLLILAISGAVNVVLNLVSVTLFGMGVEGVAIGTAASMIVSVIMSFWILGRETSIIRIEFRHLMLDFKIILELIKIGIPTALNSMSYTISNLILQNSINSLGQVVITANTIENSIANIAQVWGESVTNSVISMVSQNMGAKKYDRVKKIFPMGIVVSATGKLLYAGITFLPPVTALILNLFTDSPDVMEIVKLKMIFCVFLYVIIDPSAIATASLRGMGYSSTSTVVNYACVCLPRILWILGIYSFFEGNLYVLFSCYPFSWICSSIVLTIILRSKQNKLLKQEAQEKECLAE